MPREILTDRLIRDKKPWGVGVAAALMLGFTLSLLGYWRAWNSVFEAKFAAAMTQAQNVETEANGYTTAYGEKEAEFKQFDDMGRNIVGNVEGRLMWIEVLKALDSCLPSDPPDEQQEIKIPERQELHITDLECEHRTDLAAWYQTVQARIKEERGLAAGAAGDPAAAAGAAPGTPAPRRLQHPPGRRRRPRIRMLRLERRPRGRRARVGSSSSRAITITTSFRPETRKGPSF